MTKMIDVGIMAIFS